MNIDGDIRALENVVRTHRQTLHSIPELGFEEEKTAQYVKNALLSYGLEVESGLAKTGVAGYLFLSKAYPTIAFRSDMDALSLTEETGLPFASIHPDKMHGCGHDGHMATLLGFAQYICERKAMLRANILFVFQPAEEGPGGAQPLIDEGIFTRYGVKEIYGLHVYPEVPAGRLALCAGPMMAKPGEFDIVISGKGGHGAQPHKAIDSIVAAADLVGRLQTVISRVVDPIEAAVLTIGRIEGGDRRNIIAESVRMEGTIRAFDEGVFDLITQKIIKHCEATEKAYDVNVEIDMRPMYAPVVNDRELTESFFKANAPFVDEISPQMIAEDFALYQKVLPGLFFFVGTRNEEKNHVYPLHSGRFNFDESCLLNGIQAYKNLLKERKYWKETINGK